MLPSSHITLICSKNNNNNLETVVKWIASIYRAKKRFNNLLLIQIHRQILLLHWKNSNRNRNQGTVLAQSRAPFPVANNINQNLTIKKTINPSIKKILNPSITKILNKNVHILKPQTILTPKSTNTEHDKNKTTTIWTWALTGGLNKKNSKKSFTKSTSPENTKSPKPSTRKKTLLPTTLTKSENGSKQGKETTQGWERDSIISRQILKRTNRMNRSKEKLKKRNRKCQSLSLR